MWMQSWLLHSGQFTVIPPNRTPPHWSRLSCPSAEGAKTRIRNRRIGKSAKAPTLQGRLPVRPGSSGSSGTAGARSGDRRGASPAESQGCRHRNSRVRTDEAICHPRVHRLDPRETPASRRSRIPAGRTRGGGTRASNRVARSQSMNACPGFHGLVRIAKALGRFTLEPCLLPTSIT